METQVLFHAFFSKLGILIERRQDIFIVWKRFAEKKVKSGNLVSFEIYDFLDEISQYQVIVLPK